MRTATQDAREARKQDPVPDDLIRKILEARICAFDETIGPLYRTSAAPPGVTKEQYPRQHAALEYLASLSRLT
jgi:hypothetical protein